MKRLVVVAIGAIVIAGAAPAVAAADTGSSSTGSFSSLPWLLEGCGGVLPILTGQCNGVGTIIPSPLLP